MKTKIFSLFVTLVTAITINATVVTLNPADFEAVTTQGAICQSVKGVTVAIENGVINDTQIRIFKLRTITISAETPISAIVFTCIASGTAQYGPGCFAAQNGYSYDDKLGTYIAPVTTTSASFTASSAQVRATKIEVYFDGEIPGVVTYDTLSIAQAIAVANALADNATSEAAYVIDGYAVNVYEYSTQNKKQDFFLVENAAQPDSVLKVFRATPMKDGKAYPIVEGDQVRMLGNLQKYVKDGKTQLEIINSSLTFLKEAPRDTTPTPPVEADTITVAQALEIGKALADKAVTDKEYVIKGFSSSIIAPYDSVFKNESFWITDDKGSRSHDKAIAFRVYRGQPNSFQEIGVEAYIQIRCKITNYGGTIGNSVSVPFEVIEHDTITVAKAMEIGKTLSNNAVTEKVYVIKGYVSDIVNYFDTIYKNETFWMTDDKGSRSNDKAIAFQVYRGRPNTEKEIGLDAYLLVKCRITKNDNNSILNFGTNVSIEVIEQGFLVYTSAFPSIAGTAICSFSNVTNTYVLTASPNYGYHFLQWNDNNTENPRTITLTQDTAFVAEFAPNQYNINVNCDRQFGSIEGESGYFAYLTTHQYEAISNYGYHFTQWSDGVTQNPRILTVERDSIITAYFAPNKYKIQDGSNSCQGYINGVGAFDYLSELTITGVPQYGYHFDKWADNYSDNPRTIILTQDTTFTAEFGINQYTIHVTCNETYGHIEGANGIYEYLTTLEYKAVPNYGYHFTKWSDGETQNPRILTVVQDTAISALFTPNKYRINDGSYAEQGYIDGTGSYDYLSERIITAINHYGYHFIQWSDSIKDNPRTIVLTQDTTFVAKFAPDKNGTCGKDSALNWSYEDKSKTLTITGEGELTQNYTFGAEAPTQMKSLIIGNEVTSIGDSAFYGKTTLNHLIIGGNVASIGDYAFAECKNFDDITCYANTVPTITYYTFLNIGNKQYIYLFVPEDRERAYKRDSYWGLFDIQIMGAKSTETTDVAVTPTETTAEVVWPAVSGAATYELVIKDKSGNVICTLIFNAQGQLTSIAFNAPERNAVQQTQSAGFAFTVTGLDSGTGYDLTMTSKNSSGATLQTKTVSFVTNDPQDIDNISETPTKATKLLRDGQIFILRGEKVYTLTGQEVK